jgi:aminoglycoside phosphotransferase (APT) family kinase protein
VAATGPDAEIDIDETLVAALLQRQLPHLAGVRVRVVANGWDNAMVRIGDHLVARLPRRAAAASLVEHEQRWLPELAPHLPLATPVPVHVGVADEGYPWSWSVVSWLAGEVATRVPSAQVPDAAPTLAAFLRALHRPAPTDAPANPVRGVPLAMARERIAARLSAIGRPDLAPLWHDLVDTPVWDGPAVWVHGDLHPGNLLVHDGRLVAAIDFGDVTSGDPATDLVSAWMWLSGDQRVELRALLDIEHATWRRGAAWALAISTAVIAGGADEPLVAAAHRAVDAITAPDALR